MTNKIDLYAGIHKGQRSRFFRIAMQAGTLNYDDQKSLNALYDELSAFREEMRLHAALEERFVHPLLSDMVPGGARELEADHRIMHQQFNDLVDHFDGLRAKSDFEKRSELSLEFYRAWNRFISFYFTHINREEEEVQPTLWKLCTNEELATVFSKILGAQKPEELSESVEMMIPAMNLYERADMLLGGKASIPPQAFQALLKIVERVLSTDDWTALKSKIGIA